MTRRVVPPPLPAPVTAAQRERAVVWMFIAVGLGLASGFYMSDRDWNLPLSLNAVPAVAAPLAVSWFFKPYDRVHACLLGALLLLSVGRVWWVHPTSALLVAICSSIATALFVSFLLDRRRVARALLVLLCVVLMAVQANRLCGPWVQLS